MVTGIRGIASGALLLALGCGSTPEGAPPTERAIEWRKPGASAAELAESRTACESEALRGGTPVTDDWLNARVLGNRFVECMRLKGWTAVDPVTGKPHPEDAASER